MQIGVIGAGECSPPVEKIAEEVGREIAIALKLKKPVVGLNTWDVSKEIIHAKNAREAVSHAVGLLSAS